MWYSEEKPKVAYPMKEITAILILLSLLTSCGEQRKTAENTAENNSIGEISCEVTTTCSDMISPITTTAEIDKISQKTTELRTTVTVSENTKEKKPDDSMTTAVQMEEPVTENPYISPKNDHEKALKIYNFMRENGSGTCINYACRTYEMCRDVGLPCYIVWTNAGMYGHVANTVKIGGIWYILDTQGGYFLDYNYGFTEVVDIDGNHIADGDMLSNYSYDELN